MSTVTHLKTKVQRWAEKITAAYGDSVAAIIAVGWQLHLAKEDCSHGEWGELTGQTTGKPLLPFSARTAQRLKKTAENTALSNATHGSYLPASWRTLSVLAILDPDDIEAAIASGEIHPEMERKDAEVLVERSERKRLAYQGAEPPALFPPNRTADWEPSTPPNDAGYPLPGGRPMTDEEREYIAKSPERIRVMLDAYAARWAGEEEAAREIERLFPWDQTNDENQKAVLLGLEVMARLRELLGVLKRSELKPQFVEKHAGDTLRYYEEIGSHLPTRSTH